ncbi:MAG: hypothetical protein U0U69_09735 [Acidimicrobiia bacterium]
MKRKAIVATALAVTLAGAGATAVELILPAGAQESGTTQTQPQDPGQPPDQGTPPFVTDALSKLVADGTITQDQADAVAQALVAARPRGDDGPHGGPRGGHGPGLAAAATAIGIDESTLRSELQAGKSIAQVASDHGVDAQTVIDAIVADAQAHLAQEVADGRITQDQADQKAADLAARVTAMVNGQMPAGPAGGGHGGPPPPTSGSSSSSSGTA